MADEGIPHGEPLGPQMRKMKSKFQEEWAWQLHEATRCCGVVRFSSRFAHTTHGMCAGACGVCKLSAFGGYLCENFLPSTSIIAEAITSVTGRGCCRSVLRGSWKLLCRANATFRWALVLPSQRQTSLGANRCQRRWFHWGSKLSPRLGRPAFEGSSPGLHKRSAAGPGTPAGLAPMVLHPWPA